MQDASSVVPFASIVHDLLLLVRSHSKRVSTKLWAALRTTKNFKHIQGYAHVKFKNQKAMEHLKYLSQTQCTVHFMTVADPGIHAPYPPLMRTHVKKILA